MGPEDLALRGELSANVVGFCRLLRTKGAGVGPSETTDALLALEKIDLGKEGAHHAVYYVKNTEYQIVGIIHDNGEAFRYGPEGQTIPVGRWAHSVAPSALRSEEFAHSIRNILAIDGAIEFSPFSIPK